MYNIFVVEDDRLIREELTTLLERNGYEVSSSDDFESIVACVLDASPDLVILDLNLPCVDGHYVCRKLRAKSTIPIVVVTSRDSDIDELLSMNLGADDFIPKPYKPQILLARLSSVLRRAYRVDSSRRLNHKGMELDLAKSQVSYRGRTAELTKNELRILQLLMCRHGQIVSRADLQNELWQSDEFVDDNTLTVNVNRLRTTLAGIGVEDFLQTRRGQGYLV